MTDLSTGAAQAAISASKPSIVQERVLPASPDVVFKAWSDPESLSVWMRPAEDMAKATVSVDFRIGGRFSIVMHGAERDYPHTGEYLEIVPNRKLVFTWVSHWFEPDEQNTRVTVTLEPMGAGETKLTLVHDQLPDSNSYDGHVHGWASIVSHMSDQLARV